MSFTGENFQHKVKVGLALEPMSRAATEAITGVTISEPWSVGRQIAFVLVGGDHSADTIDATCVVQGLRRSDGTTWEALKESDGSTDLAFTATKLAGDGEIEDSTLLGTLSLDDVDGETYEAIRLVYTRGAGVGNALIGACYLITDLYRHASGQADDLFAKPRP